MSKNFIAFESNVPQELLGAFYDIPMLFAIAVALVLAIIIFASGKRTRGGMTKEEHARVHRAWKEALRHMSHADALHEKVKKVTRHALANDTLSRSERDAVKASWGAVHTELALGNESHWRTAVIRADAVLDMALRARKFPGKTMAERMARAAKKYPAVEEAFAAHRLRNELAHNPLRKISEKEARWALSVFERALKALGV